jgi:hypothetical protein
VSDAGSPLRASVGSTDATSDQTISACRTDSSKIVIGPSSSVAFASFPLPDNLWPCKRSERDEVLLGYPGHKDPEYDDGTAFLIAKTKQLTR